MLPCAKLLREMCWNGNVDGCVYTPLHIRWSEIKPSSLSEEISSWLSPLPATIVQAPSAWKASVAAKHAEILNNRSCYLPSDAQLGFRLANFIPDDMHKSYLSNSFRSKEWQKTINDVSCSFQLNKEHSRAFCIMANHICNNNFEQLKMYIGGMAGTGRPVHRDQGRGCLAPLLSCPRERCPAIAGFRLHVSAFLE